VEKIFEHYIFINNMSLKDSPFYIRILLDDIIRCFYYLKFWIYHFNFFLEHFQNSCLMIRSKIKIVNEVHRNVTIFSYVSSFKNFSNITPIPFTYSHINAINLKDYCPVSFIFRSWLKLMALILDPSGC